MTEEERMGDTINLDQAASSAKKAPGVAEAVFRALAGETVNINRGTYQSENQTGLDVYRVREKVRRFFDAPDGSETVFTANVTQALNQVLRGTLEPGDHVIISGLEHHAVTRTLTEMGVDYSCLELDENFQALPDSVDDLVTDKTRMVVLNHGSNVSGTIQPAAEIFKKAHEHGLMTVLDTAQTAGSLPISQKELGCDVLCFTGHKGLLGPQGIGGMVLTQETADQIRPTLTGGTGSHSESFRMPAELPDKFEAGTLNIPGIMGLGAALDYLSGSNVDRIHEKEIRLMRRFVARIQDLPGIRIAGGDNYQKDRLPVVSLDFSQASMSAEEAAEILDREYHIATRCGLHCAPLAHQTLGTFPQGTLRFSFGAFTREADLFSAVSALEDIITEVEE